MDAQRFPILAALLDELRQLNGQPRPPGEEAQAPDGLRRVCVPWVGCSCLMDQAQRRAVRVLLEALASGEPDVPAEALVNGGGSVRGLFEGTAAACVLVALVVPGEAPGTWRAAGPVGD
jgi:hypothetical protein